MERVLFLGGLPSLHRLAGVLAAPAFLFFSLPAHAYGPEPGPDVHVDAEDPGLQVWDRTSAVAVVPTRVGRSMENVSSPVYVPICTAPCDTTLRPGIHHLGVSLRDGEVLETDADVTIAGPSRVTATYHDRSAVRGLGFVTLFGSELGGVALLLAAPKVPSCGSNGPGEYCATTAPDPGWMAASLSMIVVGGLLSLPLLMTHDGAEVAISPLSVASLGWRKEGADAPQGLQIAVRF
jgi:hypothetical protein